MEWTTSAYGGPPVRCLTYAINRRSGDDAGQKLRPDSPVANRAGAPTRPSVRRSDTNSSTPLSLRTKYSAPSLVTATASSRPIARVVATATTSTSVKNEAMTMNRRLLAASAISDVAATVTAHGRSCVSTVRLEVAGAPLGPNATET